jgi:hypothetical protein
LFKAKEAKLAVNVEVEMPEKAVVKWEKVDSEVINGSQACRIYLT